MKRLGKLTVCLACFLLLVGVWSAAAQEEQPDQTDDDAAAAESGEEEEPAPLAEPEATNETQEQTPKSDKYLYWYEEKPTRLEEEIVTAERSLVDIKELPRAVSVVTGQEIAEGIMRTTPESLRLETGVMVQRTNLGGGSPFIRGLTGNQVLVLIDGIRLNNSTFRGGPNQYLNTIDPLFVERIEVVRGISSVLYGSDALGGVINVITKRRDNYDSNFGAGGSLLGRASSAEREETASAFFTMNATRHIGFAGTYSYKSFDDIDGGGNIGLQEPYGYNQQDFGANLDFPLTKKMAFQLGYQRSEAYDVPGFDPDNPINEFDPQQRDLFSLRYLAQDLHQVVDVLEIVGAVHHQREGRNQIKAAEPAVLVQDLDAVLTYHAGLKIESQAASYFRLVWGGEYYRDEVSSTRHRKNLSTGEKWTLQGRFADDSLFQSAASYIQFQVTPLYWMRIVPGVRYSWFQVDADLEDPTLGALEFDSEIDDVTWAWHLMFDATENNHIILGMARGFRVPSIDDMTKLGSEDGRFDIPNDDLDAETAMSYELGYRTTYDNVKGSVFGYYTELDDLIARQPATFDGQTEIGEDEVSQNRNIGKAYIWGVEGEINLLLPPNWLLATAASYTFGQNETDDEPLRRIPPLMGHARIRYASDDERFIVEPYVIWAGKQDRLSEGDKNDVRIPAGGTAGFVTYNLRLGFHFSTHISIWLLGENLSDVKYKWHGSGLWEAGRNFKGALDIHFDL